MNYFEDLKKNVLSVLSRCSTVLYFQCSALHCLHFPQFFKSPTMCKERIYSFHLSWKRHAFKLDLLIIVLIGSLSSILTANFRQALNGYMALHHQFVLWYLLNVHILINGAQVFFSTDLSFNYAVIHS